MEEKFLLFNTEFNKQLQTFENNMLSTCHAMRKTYEHFYGPFNKEFNQHLIGRLQNRATEAYQKFLFDISLRSADPSIQATNVVSNASPVSTNSYDGSTSSQVHVVPYMNANTSQQVKRRNHVNNEDGSDKRLKSEYTPTAFPKMLDRSTNGIDESSATSTFKTANTSSIFGGSSSNAITSHYNEVDTFENTNALDKRGPSTPWGIGFVGEYEKFKCGVSECYFSGNESEIQKHLEEKHDSNDDFVCLHCKRNIEVKNAMSHLRSHRKYLYTCSTCDCDFVIKHALISHIIREHPDKIFKFKCKNQSKASVEENTIEFVCNMCEKDFKMVNDLTKHFRDKHESLIIDFTGIQTAGAIDDLKQKFYLQKRLMCSIEHCNKGFENKTTLIDHRNKFHASTDIQMQISKIWHLYPNQCPDIKNFTRQNSRFDRNILFYCSHCGESDRMVYYSDVNCVRNHWGIEHAADSNRNKFFEFKISTLVGCNYCRTISTCEGLKKHQKDKHPGKEYVVCNLIDKDKCGLCNVTASNVSHHFITVHHLILSANIPNPVSIARKTLEQILDINLDKKLECFSCQQIFNDESELKIHNSSQHKGSDTFYEEFNDRKPKYLIAGCCGMKLNHLDLSKHFECHDDSDRVKCRKSECKFETSNLFKLAKHYVYVHDAAKDPLIHLDHLLQIFFYQTWVVFGNGLKLSKCNLIGTGHCDYKRARETIHRMVLRIRANKSWKT